ncbi:MAG: glycoside hydrolase family 108 protein [Parvibaculum sp.]|uniref:glycoside hydrolase family 108 protein n=1 Tax=Chelatococcus sp. TaxID=1953771 RepID=UPI001EBD2B02|nr:glycosyl hydrolase 108 family protein [Chelatococcus sp.]MBX3506865.1 glycoside hydrolase family 108 protein [Parvibaculum sp.]MBX3545571.1 glycoside hydrolase family 108 protein [Chelatococcus sp.]
MTIENFQKALDKALVHEGGKVDDPRDPGGRTNQGVTQRVYDGYRQRIGLPKRDVYLMTPAERDAIYKRQYWDVIRGDDLPPGVDYFVFDGAINSGPLQSVKWIQRALGTVKVDGHLGDATLGAIMAHGDHDMLIADAAERRMTFLRALKTWKTFGNGWTRRVDQVERVSQAWAMGSVGPEVSWVPEGNRKALVSDAKPLPTMGAADGATGGGAIAATLAAAQNQLQPLTGNSAFIDSVVAGLVVAGVGVTVGGLAYRFYAKRKEAALRDALDLVERAAPELVAA